MDCQKSDYAQRLRWPQTARHKNAGRLHWRRPEQNRVWPGAIAFHTGDVFDQPSEQIPYLGQFITTEPVNVGDRSQPSLEVIAQIQPDLIVGEAGGNGEVYGLLSQIAPTLLWDIRTNRGQWQQNLKTLALALGDESKAEAALADLQQDIAATRDKLQSVVSNAPKALMLGANRLTSGNSLPLPPKAT